MARSLTPNLQDKDLELHLRDLGFDIDNLRSALIPRPITVSQQSEVPVRIVNGQRIYVTTAFGTFTTGWWTYLDEWRQG